MTYSEFKANYALIIPIQLFNSHVKQLNETMYMRLFLHPTTLDYNKPNLIISNTNKN